MELRLERKEEWRKLSRCNDYEVSSLGRIRSLDRTISCKNGVKRNIIGRILKQGISTNGYKYVICRINGKSVTIYTHQEVARAFIGNPCGLDVDHINSIKTDNRFENLRYLTHFENSSRANKGKHRDNGMEKNSKAKLVIGHKDGIEIERFDCAKKISIKYGVGYSKLRYHLQRGGIEINNIKYRYGTSIAT